jgi:peptide/nickel transport system ATP-binding protein
MKRNEMPTAVAERALKPNSQRSNEPLLRAQSITVHFQSRGQTVHALSNVSFDVYPGETFGMVGETGAGKSLTAWTVMGLLPAGATLKAGSISFHGRDLTNASQKELGTLRGREIAIVTQSPQAALNPMARIGDQLANAYRAHASATREEALERAVEGLRQVGISDPGRRAKAYPHQLSIGMAQRVMIAMALLHEPKLLIADEPTSGLDVTIQAEVLDLVMTLVRERGSALWLITHDLGVVANYCERAAVMFAGQIVEEAPVERLFNLPSHPYTLGLIDSRLSGDRERARFRIGGPAPDLVRLPTGCRFAYRCPWAEPACEQTLPQLETLRLDHRVRCFVAHRRTTSTGDH